jgi:Type II secretion system (T2SS), protein G
MEGYSNEVTDGWGRPILWRVEGDDIILTSYGRDGVPGGAGEDADMIGVFRTRTADGRWADELCDWRRNPFDTEK